MRRARGKDEERCNKRPTETCAEAYLEEVARGDHNVVGELQLVGPVLVAQAVGAHAHL